MTDNEIIKALERCAMRGKGALEREVCGKCPYYNTMCCEEHLLVDSVLLINRQKAEIERLKGFVTPTVQLVNEYDIMIAKTEAIKEFAERLKEEADNIDIDREGDFISTASGEWKMWSTVGEWGKEIADNLVKEMVGDDNENV